MPLLVDVRALALAFAPPIAAASSVESVEKLLGESAGIHEPTQFTQTCGLTRRQAEIYRHLSAVFLQPLDPAESLLQEVA